MGEERFGTHHSKFAIIKYLNGVRICITTANFIPEDFTYRTQGIFIQDFPAKAPGHGQREIESTGDFESTLFDYLQALRVTSSSARKILDALIHSLSTEYDFSSAEVVLIPSLPGRYSSSNPRRRNSLGIAKLSHLLKEEYSQIGDDVLKSLTLVMQFSSLGSMGKDAKLVDDYVARMLPTPTNLQSNVQRNKVEIVWPTVDCVRNSLQVSSCMYHTFFYKCYK
jgi:tyrosyl-DNA phosphodiesterase-1